MALKINTQRESKGGTKDLQRLYPQEECIWDLKIPE